MYYDALKQVLANKTVLVVVETGEWYDAAIGVCFTRAEAEQFIIDYPNKKYWYEYKIVEQSIGKALEEFDERTKRKTIRDEGEAIAKEVDYNIRTGIEREIEKKYTEILEPIRDTLDTLVRRGV